FHQLSRSRRAKTTDRRGRQVGHLQYRAALVFSSELGRVVEQRLQVRDGARVAQITERFDGVGPEFWRRQMIDDWSEGGGVLQSSQRAQRGGADGGFRAALQ